MIKPNELRIDNWVIHHNKLTDESVYHQVTVGTFSKLTFHAKEYDPIPLTPEVLEKCGFYQPIGTTWRHKDNNILLFAPGVPGQGYGLSINGRGILRTVQYLHELQNLFFYNTGKELPIEL